MDNFLAITPNWGLTFLRSLYRTIFNAESVSKCKIFKYEVKKETKTFRLHAKEELIKQFSERKINWEKGWVRTLSFPRFSFVVIAILVGYHHSYSYNWRCSSKKVHRTAVVPRVGNFCGCYWKIQSFLEKVFSNTC